MEKWEYSIEVFNWGDFPNHRVATDSLKEYLNKKGSYGWELVSIDKTSEELDTFYFKRRVFPEDYEIEMD